MREARECMDELRNIKHRSDNELDAERAWKEAEAIITKHMAKRKARLVEALGRAVNEYCECGGSGPDHPQCCDACKIYHRVKAVIKEA